MPNSCLAACVACPQLEKQERWYEQVRVEQLYLEFGLLLPAGNGGGGADPQSAPAQQQKQAVAPGSPQPQQGACHSSSGGLLWHPSCDNGGEAASAAPNYSCGSRACSVLVPNT